MKKLIAIIILFLLPSILTQPPKVRVSEFSPTGLKIIEDVIRLEGYKLKVVRATLVIDDVLFDKHRTMFIFIKCLKVEMGCFYGFVIMTNNVNETHVIQVGPLDGYLI